jgi:LysR family glycine cleavage system transcriptional activator
MSNPIPAHVHARLAFFLAVARRLSFTHAAEDLNVTTGAVSQQIKALESWLGFKLFRRLARGLDLTDEGRRLLAAVHPAHDAVGLAINRLHGGELSGIVRLRSVPSFLSVWLLPRLPGLLRAHPNIELQVVAEDSSLSLRARDYDLAIDLNDGDSPGFESTGLMNEEIFPVCSPALLEGRPPLRTPEDLRHYPLLHDITAWRGSQPYAEWERYLEAIDCAHVDVRRGYMFNRNHITIEAAIVGMGVAMARRTLTTDELASGRLIAPFPRAVQTGKRYCIVHSAGALEDRRVRAVHDWIAEQARAAAPPLLPSP